jgi:hypothetical protein
MKSVRPLNFAQVLAMVGALALGAGAQTITMTVDTSRTGPAIFPLMYGFFTELLSNMLGHCEFR